MSSLYRYLIWEASFMNSFARGIIVQLNKWGNMIDLFYRKIEFIFDSVGTFYLSPGQQRHVIKDNTH